MRIAALGLYLVANLLPATAFAQQQDTTRQHYDHATDCGAILAIAVVKAKGQDPVNDNVVTMLEDAARKAIGDAIETGKGLGISREQAVKDMTDKVDTAWENSTVDERKKCVDDYA